MKISIKAEGLILSSEDQIRISLWNMSDLITRG